MPDTRMGSAADPALTSGPGKRNRSSPAREPITTAMATGQDDGEAQVWVT